jgi:hypothetical protein
LGKQSAVPQSNAEPLAADWASPSLALIVALDPLLLPQCAFRAQALPFFCCPALGHVSFAFLRR